MGFFKKLFSSKDSNEKAEREENIRDIFSDDYFNRRYTEENIHDNPTIVDGCLKMLNSYFIDNKIDEPTLQPINHPINLDKVVNDGFGFHLYCKALKLEDKMTTSFLAIGFSDFLINKYGFKLYKDNEPEFPARSMSLKYDKYGALLSLYPFEYALKVLSHEASFQNLHTRLESQLKSMPTKDEVIAKYLDGSKEL